MCDNAKVTTPFLHQNNVHVLHPWSVVSPDLNPIKYLFDVLDRHVRNAPNPPKTFVQLENELTRAWNNLPLSRSPQANPLSEAPLCWLQGEGTLVIRDFLFWSPSHNEYHPACVWNPVSLNSSSLHTNHCSLLENFVAIGHSLCELWGELWSANFLLHNTTYISKTACLLLLFSDLSTRTQISQT